MRHTAPCHPALHCPGSAHTRRAPRSRRALMKGRARPCSALGMAPNMEEQREVWQELTAGVRAHSAAVRKKRFSSSGQRWEQQKYTGGKTPPHFAPRFRPSGQPSCWVETGSPDLTGWKDVRLSGTEMMTFISARCISLQFYFQPDLSLSTFTLALG